MTYNIRSTGSKGNSILYFAVLCVFLTGCGDPDIFELKRQLTDSDPGVRKSAAKDLEELGTRAAPAVEELANCLTDKNPEVRYRAIKSLSKIGRPASAEMKKIAKAMVTDTDKEIRYYSAKTIELFADEAKPVVAELSTGLADSYAKVRYYSAKTLGKLGADGSPSLSALEKLLRDPDESVRKAAESAIRRIKKKYGSEG